MLRQALIDAAICSKQVGRHPGSLMGQPRANASSGPVQRFMSASARLLRSIINPESCRFSVHDTMPAWRAVFARSNAPHFHVLLAAGSGRNRTGSTITKV